MEDVKEKECYYCHTFKSLNEFNKCITGVYGYHNHCRSCQKIVKRNWYIKHRNEELQKSKIYSQSSQAKEYRKQRWIKLKHVLKPISNARRRTEVAKIKARIQRNNWYQIPHNRIAHNLRGRIRQVLKGIAKVDSTEQLTGCTFLQLKNYIESKFLPNMTWDNYGQWHIDHIKPCASFDLTQESQQKECFHYSNLQPLWAEDNISKSDNVTI